MAKTLREKYIEALTKEGYKRIEDGRSSKYVVFERTGNSKWYVGKSGALRVGLGVAHSVPVSEKTKKFLLSRIGEVGLGGSVECPHCKWGFMPNVIEQHIREKHS